MRATCGITLGLSLLLSTDAFASDLVTRINQFFQQQYANHANYQVQVTVKSPPAQWPECEATEISQPVNTRPWGNVSLSVRCGQQRQFIQVMVEINGQYVVAKRHIAAGAKITPADISLKQGRLNTLPVGTLLEPDYAANAVSLRNITAGQPLIRTMLRRAWVVRAGQGVQILTQGDGFNVSSKGKAMDNAAVKESVRVRMTSGQIINGIAAADGIIHVML